jgi:hypothetical protein
MMDIELELAGAISKTLIPAFVLTNNLSPADETALAPAELIKGIEAVEAV